MRMHGGHSTRGSHPIIKTMKARYIFFRVNADALGACITPEDGWTNKQLAPPQDLAFQEQGCMPFCEPAALITQS
jgi:hypothetical protein